MHSYFHACFILVFVTCVLICASLFEVSESSSRSFSSCAEYVVMHIALHEDHRVPVAPLMANTLYTYLLVGLVIPPEAPDPHHSGSGTFKAKPFAWPRAIYRLFSQWLSSSPNP